MVPPLIISNGSSVSCKNGTHAELSLDHAMYELIDWIHIIHNIVDREHGAELKIHDIKWLDKMYSIKMEC